MLPLRPKYYDVRNRIDTMHRLSAHLNHKSFNHDSAEAHFGRERRRNSHSLNQAVKNNNQEYSVKGGSLTLRLSQVDCAVITSPEDPGEESFQEREEKLVRRLGGTSCSAGITTVSSPSKGNMNADTSSTGQENSRCSSCFIHLLCFLSMKLNV